MASPLSIFSLFLQFILIPLSVIAQKTSPIQPGTTLSTDNSYWKSSPSGDFSFGFHQINNTNNYLLSIWYSNIQDTIVWYAGADGILAPKGSVLNCTADQGLVLKDDKGNKLSSLDYTSGTASSCFLNDTGNLMIKGTKGDTLWQSFDYPRDTLLPTQMMRTSQLGGPKDVYSKHSRTNFTRGKFQLRLLDGGDLLLNARNLVTDSPYDDFYYSSYTSDSVNTSKSGYMVDYDLSGHMHILKRNGDSVLDLLDGKNVLSPKEDYYFKATLNFDGVFAWYYRKKEATNGSSSWTVITWKPENMCDDLVLLKTMYGVCGFNGICKIVNGDYPGPICECPPKYSLVDPNDPFGNCKPDFKLQMYDEEPGYKLQKMPSTDWPRRDYDKFSPISVEECQTSCLNDFQCVAIILNGQTCWKKSFPLVNGKIDVTRTAFLKVSDVKYVDNTSQVCVPPIPIVPKQYWKGMNALTSTFLGSSIFINVICVVLGCWLFLRRNPRVPRTLNNTLQAWSSTISCFTYKELEEATNGFREELGRGACAIVYKGAINDTQTLVAIKKIDRTFLREADREFTTEVSIIGKTQHRNLVRLVGYCKEEDHRMLVYEFMRNGNLAEFLFGETRPRWLERVRIAQGVARGLLYLHEDCGSQIIHCDIKPQNILLDDYFEARIADFGLSKLLMLDQSQTHTAIRGTKGYVAPEWFTNKPVTVKVDVYSFGVVLLEIISCTRCINREQGEEERVILIDWALDCYLSGDVSALVKGDNEALDDYKMVEKLVEVAMWCIQEDPNLRPTMRRVTLMLEGVIEVPTPPSLDHDSLTLNIVSK